jgi:hypothetical protein
MWREGNHNILRLAGKWNPEEEFQININQYQQFLIYGVKVILGLYIYLGSFVCILDFADFIKKWEIQLNITLLRVRLRYLKIHLEEKFIKSTQPYFQN